MDIYTPTGADTVDDIPPYIGGRRHGQISDVPYKDDVAGSSPVPPTKEIRHLQVIVSAFFLVFGSIVQWIV